MLRWLINGFRKKVLQQAPSNAGIPGWHDIPEVETEQYAKFTHNPDAHVSSEGWEAENRSLRARVKELEDVNRSKAGDQKL